MNSYEELLDEISGQFPVIEVNLNRHESDGFYKNGKIFINSQRPLNTRKEALGEEYGHAMTSVGVIIRGETAEERKQELKARRYGYEKIVTLDHFIDLYEKGITDFFEAAEYLDISADYLRKVLNHYFVKYGTSFIYRERLLSLNDDYITIIPIEELKKD